MKLEGKITDVEFEDIDYPDYPDFCDAHIVSAKLDGVAMTSEQIDALNEDHDYVYELLMKHIY